MTKPFRNHHEPDLVTGRRCMAVATTRDGYCGSCKATLKRKAVYERTAKRSHNRSMGFCRCGDLPLPGWRTCLRCALLDRESNRRRRERRREIKEERGRLGIASLFGQFGRRRQRAQTRKDEERLERMIEGEHLPPLQPPMLTNTERREHERVEKQAAFVRFYVGNGGNGEKAALAAGYGAESAKRGGRAAHVRAHRLLRDSRILTAIIVETGRVRAELPA